MSKTKIVMMAMVITRFVAILEVISAQVSLGGALAPGKVALPTSHASEGLDNPVDIALTIVQNASGMVNRLALPMEIS